MKISEAEKITGLTAKAIRLYEEKGLISVARKDNSYRDYSEEDIDKLKFISSLREMGISLSQICLHFNGVITFEELLDNRKREMEKENIFHNENYNKCVRSLEMLRNKGVTAENKTGFMSSIDVILGLDIGTTNISAVIVDLKDKTVLETYIVPNGSKLPSENDFFEFDVNWICTKVNRIVEFLSEAYTNIKAIGLTGQMHGVLYISENGEAVSPLYNWQDGRGNRIFSKNKTYSDEIFERCGYVCNSGYGFVTLFYNKTNNLEPLRAKSFCTIMDYAAMVLTGNKHPVMHISNAASLGLYDLEKNEFDQKAIEKLALSHLSLPVIAVDDSNIGYYKNIPVYVAIGDNQASFFGSVSDEKTSALLNFGTGSQVSVVTDNIAKIHDELEIRPYLFGKYIISGSSLCGGRAYAITEKFFREFVCALSTGSGSQYEIMNIMADKAYQKGEEPLNVSTLFCGTRNNPEIRGSICNIDDKNFTPGNLILGVLRGMANELKNYFDKIDKSDITDIVASGNAVKKNPVFQKVLRDVFRSDIILTDNNEEAAIGCALYAEIAMLKDK